MLLPPLAEIGTMRYVLLNYLAHAFVQASLPVTIRKIKQLPHFIQKMAILHANFVNATIQALN